MVLNKLDEVFQTVVRQGKLFWDKANGYGLGSGNSIPGYIPVDGFMAMIKGASAIRKGEL